MFLDSYKITVLIDALSNKASFNLQVESCEGAGLKPVLGLGSVVRDLTKRCARRA